MLVMFSVPVPVLVSVTLCAALVVPVSWLPKVKLVLDNETAGATEVTPLPVKPMVCGLPLALSVIATLAVLVPVAVGVNVTVMAQFVLAATVLPQVLVCA